MSSRKDLRQRIAASLRVARRAKRLTQEDLAAKVGCSVETISNAERGASLPGLDLFLELATVLNINWVALIEDTKVSRPKSKARLTLEAEALQLVRSLKDERLRLWLETGKVFERD
jgi:transcriptional regulator with XRE-family HTH domain